MRVSHLWSAVAAMAVLGLACGRDRSREAAMRQDTSGPTAAAPAPAPAPSAAPSTDTTAAAPRDTMVTPAVPPETTAAKPQRPSMAVAQKPAAPAAKPSREPKQDVSQDTSKVRPNIDSGRTARRPKVPPPTQPAPQDTTAQQQAPLRDIYHQAPRDTVSQVVYNGWKQFNLNCARCHGEDVMGTTIAPHLTESLKPEGPINTKALFIQTVCNGRPEKGMPAWCSLGLDTATIEQIYAYVKGRSDGKIHPGRPAVR